MKRKPQIIIGIILIVIFVLLAVAAPLLAPNDPNATDLALKNAPPSAEYPLGCDQMGRCELSRLIYGARYSLGLSIPVLIILASLSLFIGCYSSYKSGIVDEIMRLICDIFMAFPLIVIAMSLVSAVDNSVASIIIAIGISMTTWFLRMVRSYAKTECGKEYIEAARISGASNFRIVTRHLIPNVLPQFELTPNSAVMMDWYAMVQGGQYGLTIFKTQGGFYDPANVVTNINPQTSMDPILMLIGTTKPEMAELVSELDASTDETRIQEIYNTILTTIADENLTTPLVYMHQLAIYSDKVKDYTFPMDSNFTSIQNIKVK